MGTPSQPPTAPESSPDAARQGTRINPPAGSGTPGRTYARPKLWVELALLGVCYMFYSLVRNAVPEQAETAQRHAASIWSVERHLGMAMERSVNHWVDSVSWLVVGMNYYYATLHFIVTLGVLIWLYRCHGEHYRLARTTLLMTTGLALIGYYLYPLAPPRLMTGGGFIDTVVTHGTWGSLASGDLATVSNQYAAMPSMHAGWSLWCACTVAALSRRTWVRVLAVCYPLATAAVIVSTANHFILDAVGGAVCLGLGYALAQAVLRLIHHLPEARALPVKQSLNYRAPSPSGPQVQFFEFGTGADAVDVKNPGQPG